MLERFLVAAIVGLFANCDASADPNSHDSVRTLTIDHSVFSGKRLESTRRPARDGLHELPETIAGIVSGDASASLFGGDIVISAAEIRFAYRDEKHISLVCCGGCRWEGIDGSLTLADKMNLKFEPTPRFDLDGDVRIQFPGEASILSAASVRAVSGVLETTKLRIESDQLTLELAASKIHVSLIDSIVRPSPGVGPSRRKYLLEGNAKFSLADDDLVITAGCIEFATDGEAVPTELIGNRGCRITWQESDNVWSADSFRIDFSSRGDEHRVTLKGNAVVTFDDGDEHVTITADAITSKDGARDFVPSGRNTTVQKRNNRS